MITFVLIGLGIIIILLLLKTNKKELKKEEKPKPVIVEDELCEEAELKKLAVIYEGRFLAQDEVIEVPYNEKVSFKAKGFDISGTKEICISGNQAIWLKSCPCVHWEFDSGIINSVWVNNKTKNIARNVWIKYSNGVTFKWKIMVV